MDKLNLIIRGGVPTWLKDDIDTIIKDAGQHNGVFVSDIKTHSIELYIDGGSMVLDAVIKRIQGAAPGGFSIITQHYGTENVLVLGKMMSSEIAGTVTERAQGLFKG